MDMGLVNLSSIMLIWSTRCLFVWQNTTGLNLSARLEPEARVGSRDLKEVRNMNLLM